MCKKEIVMFTAEDGRILDVTTMVELGGDPQGIVENLNLGTMDRHEFMYKFAEVNPAKGKKGGSCNITQCQREGASCYNGGTCAYYCTKCWDDIYYSATYGGLDPQEWIKPEFRKEDYNYVYASDDILENMDELVEKVYDTVRDKKIYRGKSYRYDKTLYEGDINRHAPWVREQPKIGRNNKCPCGSGKKYKKCCEVFNG